MRITLTRMAQKLRIVDVDAPPPNRVTLKDIALSLGLCQATVSLAMRDNPRIPVERREQIKAAAMRMGYRPNPAATTLAHLKHSASFKPIESVLAWLNFWPDPK